MQSYRDVLFTPEIEAEQRKAGSLDANVSRYDRLRPSKLGPDEVAFLAARDSVYMSSVTSAGWPYLQHRGGPAGFIKQLDGRTIGFADYRGNRQYVSKANIGTNDRVALFAIDYPRKARLKLLGHATVTDAADTPDMAAKLAVEGEGRVERCITVRIAAFDWNCPQFITQRFTTVEIAAPVGTELERLEMDNAAQSAEVAALKDQLAAKQ